MMVGLEMYERISESRLILVVLVNLVISGKHTKYLYQFGRGAAKV